MVTVNENCLKQNLARNMRYLRLSRNPRISQTMLANKLGVSQEVSLNNETDCIAASTIRLGCNGEMLRYHHR